MRLADQAGKKEPRAENAGFHRTIGETTCGTLSEDEAWGLAGLYNSRLIDTWFRAVNGNTQVSATELRAMPLPARETIVALGRVVKRLDDPVAGLDEPVARIAAPPALQEAAVG